MPTQLQAVHRAEAAANHERENHQIQKADNYYHIGNCIAGHLRIRPKVLYY